MSTGKLINQGYLSQINLNGSKLASDDKERLTHISNHEKSAKDTYVFFMPKTPSEAAKS